MTPTLLADIVDPLALQAAISEGLVRARQHPTLDLTIYNYSERAQYERIWNQVTRNCRGLIVNGAGEVVARPWSKFFNYGEHEQERGDLTPLDLSAPVEVTDKMDGSLGILYGDAIATRGSFISEQARHATEVYRQKHASRWTPTPGLTYLFEIIYPENRIVLDYRGQDDLVLLGAVQIADGKRLGPDDLPEWPGPRTITYAYPTLADALAAKPRPNAEGLVVRYLDTGLMVKIKQDDYVALHKLVTGLNERVVWEHLSSSGSTDDLVASIPDEFHEWVWEKASALRSLHAVKLRQAEITHAGILTQLPGRFGRGEYAAMAKRYTPDVMPLLFNLLDGKDPSPAIWKQLRPRGDTYMLGITEDVA